MAKKKQARKRARKEEPLEEESLETGMDMTEAMSMQSIHDGSVAPELLSKETTIMGRTIRPITMETIILLKQVDSPLISGVNLDEIENIFYDCCVFITLQSGDPKEARRLAWEPDELKEKALDLAATIPASQFASMSNEVNSLLRDSTSTSVEAKPPKGSKDNDPLGNS